MYSAEEYFERIKSSFLELYGTRIDFLRDSGVYRTPLYDFLRRMPKGADLHAHADAILPMDEQVAFLKDHPELVITPEWQIHYSGLGAPYGSRTMAECLEDGMKVEASAAIGLSRALRRAVTSGIGSKGFLQSAAPSAPARRSSRITTPA